MECINLENKKSEEVFEEFLSRLNAEKITKSNINFYSDLVCLIAKKAYTEGLETGKRIYRGEK